MISDKISGKFLVSGAAGFIGTALSRCLSTQDCQLFLVDLPERFEMNHQQLGECFEIDIRTGEELRKLKDIKFDGIFHLAAQTSGRVSNEEPEHDVDTNIKGMVNILQLAQATNCTRLVFTSSMAVYGNSDIPIDETFPFSPMSNYGASKVSSEVFLRMYQKRGVNSSILRLFNVYGPGQDFTNMKQGMLSIFLAQALKSNVISVTGSLDRFRDFVYIDDVSSALVKAMNFTSMGSNIFNVGTGVKTTIKDLIAKIATGLGSSIDNYLVENIGSHIGDQQGTVACIELLKNQGWLPNVGLEEGISRTISWLSSQNEDYSIVNSQRK